MNKADFSYTSSSIKYDNVGQSAWGQFTDGYFTIGLAYTFNVEKGNNRNATILSKSDTRRNIYSNTLPRSKKENKEAKSYKKKVKKRRNKAFEKQDKRGGRIAW